MSRSAAENRKLVVDYIRTHRDATVTDIQEPLHVNIHRLFGGIKQAFDAAGIEYKRNLFDSKLRKRDREKLRILAIRTIRENPLITSYELNEKIKSNVYRLFGSLKEAFKRAGVEWVEFHAKRKPRKVLEIVRYIREHPNATQWEINRRCKTHVQTIFKGGIKDAFQLAKIQYPKDRKVYGVAKSDVKRSACDFQNEVVGILKNFGDVRAQVRTLHGIVDAVLTIDGTPIIVEVKDYHTKPISEPEIRQVKKYLSDLNCRVGVIVCRSRNSGNNNFKIGSHRILIKTKDEILKQGVVV